LLLLCHLCLVSVWPSLCHVFVCLRLGFFFSFSVFSSLMFSCLVLFCLILSCFVLFCLSLSCLVLSCRFLSWSLSLFWSCSCLILSCVVYSLCCLGDRVGSSLVVLKVFWHHLWSSWESFWVFRVVLGRFLAVLGVLEAVLVRVDAPERGPPIYRPLWSWFLDPSWVLKGCQDGAKDETLGLETTQEADKTAHKTTKNRTENRLQKRSRLRVVLRPSWGDLGPILAPAWGHVWWFCIGCCTTSWKSAFSIKSRFNTHLGSILGRFGWPRGCLGRPWRVKLGVRRSQDLVLGGLKALRS